VVLLDKDIFLKKKKNIPNKLTHLSWPHGIGFGLGSVLLLKISSLIFSDVNLSRLI